MAGNLPHGGTVLFHEGNPSCHGGAGLHIQADASARRLCTTTPGVDLRFEPGWLAGPWHDRQQSASVTTQPCTKLAQDCPWAIKARIAIKGRTRRWKDTSKEGWPSKEKHITCMQSSRFMSIQFIERCKLQAT
eukprot:358247-Chlamydomonas_euryale.AAC.6